MKEPHAPCITLLLHLLGPHTVKTLLKRLLRQRPSCSRAVVAAPGQGLTLGEAGYSGSSAKTKRFYQLWTPLRRPISHAPQRPTHPQPAISQ